MSTREQARASIWVRFSYVGFHCWPDAPSRRSYLRHPHRHMFDVEVGTTTDHDDREIEFHDLRDGALSLFRSLAIAKNDFGSQSCEMLARRLGTLLADSHARTFSVTVSEDGECGASVVIGPEIDA